jgi:hypothetical protein
MLCALGSRLRSALGGFALGGFLLFWLTVWPFWLLFNRYLPAPALPRHASLFRR